MEEPQPAADPDAVSSPSKRRRRLLPWLLLALIIGISIWNLLVFLPVRTALRSDGPHSVIAYRAWLLSPSRLVLDVREASGSGSMADMDRMLFKAAEALKDRHFSDVALAYRGKTRFILSGSDFKEIGSSFSYQNPVYLVRTLPEKLKRPDGSSAFGTWTGGLLGVLNKQLQDHSDFHQQWYPNDAF